MTLHFVAATLLCLVFFQCSGASIAQAASAPPNLAQAKQQAEAKGLSFIPSRDEIVAAAKKEGKVRVLTALQSETYKPMIESFKKKYPFLDAEIQELTGADAFQRFALELNAGSAKDWDIVHATDDFYIELAAHARKIDILAMAEQNVLRINPKMIDPELRAVVAVASAAGVIAYNKNLIAADRVPNSLEDFLKPEFKGRKFLVDIRPHWMASLFPGLGKEAVLEYARKLKDQQPVWASGQTSGLVSITNGEYPMYHLVNYHSCVRVLRRDTKQSLTCKVIEPVPVRFQESGMVINTAPRPHAALLFLEHETSPEGQKVIDEFGPVKSHLYAGGEINKIIQGKKISLNDYRTYHNSPEWMKLVVEAFGFPRADKK
jgi:ABC-type Fe3+ transport system substrate-binding protein